MMEKISLTVVFLMLFGGLVLTGCNQNNCENPPAVGQPEGETPEGENGPTIRPVVEGEPETPVVEGEGETPAEGEPETPPTEGAGSIVITGTLFKGLPATKALSADESGLTVDELSQAFLEIAAATDGLTLMLDGDGNNDYKKSCTVQSDGSFFLRMTSLLPGNYKLAMNTMSSTTGIAGWGKSGVDVTIEAGKVTQVTVALERMTTYAILGYFSDKLSAEEDWSGFEAFLVDTAGNNYTAVLAINDLGEWTINGYNIPVASIIEALKIAGDDIETMMFAVDTTNTAFENGYSLFDVIDNEAMMVLTPDTGTIDITVPPIDLGEGEDEEGESEGEGEKPSITFGCPDENKVIEFFITLPRGENISSYAPNFSGQPVAVGACSVNSSSERYFLDPVQTNGDAEDLMGKTFYANMPIESFWEESMGVCQKCDMGVFSAGIEVTNELGNKYRLELSLFDITYGDEKKTSAKTDYSTPPLEYVQFYPAEGNCVIYYDTEDFTVVARDKTDESGRWSTAPPGEEINQVEVGQQLRIWKTWPTEMKQFGIKSTSNLAELGFHYNDYPVNHPAPQQDNENCRWAWSVGGYFNSPGEKVVTYSFYDNNDEWLSTVETLVTVTGVEPVTTPTIEFSCPVSGRIPVSIRIPEDNEIQDFLINPWIGQIKYVGMAGPNGNWIWDPATSPSNPDVVEVTITDPDAIELTTSFEPWAASHFLGTPFAVDVDGNVSFFHLTRWKVRYGINESVVVDDGQGSLIIEFNSESGGC